MAAFFEKRHDHVLQAIDGLATDLAPEKSGSLFIKQLAFDPAANRDTRSFDLTKDGFALLAMGFTGPKALAFKLRYIERFNTDSQPWGACSMNGKPGRLRRSS